MIEDTNVETGLAEVVDPETKRKNEFIQQLMEARRPKVVEHKPQPMPRSISAQTKLEMETGRARVAKNKEQERPRAPVKQTDATTIPVFRPEDWVPSMTQGKNGARSVS